MPTPRTRIVATVGPASAPDAVFTRLLDAGVDVARLNCAHGDRAARTATIRRMRACAAGRERPLAVRADLAGPKVRVGRFRGGSAELLAGGEFTLTPRDVEGDETQASVSHSKLAGDVGAGDTIFLNDGLVRLVVTGLAGDDVHTEVVTGGAVADFKGLAVPSADLAIPTISDSDLADLDALVEAEVDFVGLSFTRSRDDVEQLRSELRARGSNARLVAKIETARAVERLEEIVPAADAIMVARGDLGVECPIEDVPGLQKHIISVCRRLARPVITATQMLESMIEQPSPTRAEATDVANAVVDGTDAVMLSAETATGRYPVETVEVMRRILTRAEQIAPRPIEAEGGRGAALDANDPYERRMADAVARSACVLADSLDVAAIVCITQSGRTARWLSKWRPRQPILAVTPHETTWRRLALGWGLEPVRVDAFASDFDRACRDVLDVLRDRGRIAAGRHVVLTAGVPFAELGRTNTVRVERV